MTHTFAKLPVSPATYDEIHGKLLQAGYEHAFVDGVIDMHGIGLVRNTSALSRDHRGFTVTILGHATRHHDGTGTIMYMAKRGALHIPGLIDLDVQDNGRYLAMELLVWPRIIDSLNQHIDS